MIPLLGRVLLFLFLESSAAHAHDPSAWGGLFRTRDHGATWLPVSEGRFVSAALGLAISPTDVNHILLATDSGLLRSRNGGRDWDLEAPTVLIGAVFAAAFDARGEGAIASTASGLFRTEDGTVWRKTSTPSGATPARAIIRVAERGYLAGPDGLWWSNDGGSSWQSAPEGLPDGAVTALVVVGEHPRRVYAVASGRIWSGTDGTDSWEPRDQGLPEGAVDTLSADPRDPERLWAVAADQVFRSDDRGRHWRAVGRPLDETGTSVRGIAVAPLSSAIVLTTHRGLFRSADGGQQWTLVEDPLPVHLEAGPLLRDPHDPATLYAGFALRPYDEIWRTAIEGGTPLARLDALSLLGGAAFLVVLALAAFGALRGLGRYYRAPDSESARQVSETAR
jgi:photosystem II stability/assembly factor-like uncharacterized protein